MPRIAVIDFETTGLSPGQGDRATEVAIVMVEGGEVVGRFQSLMNAGVRISAFIESFTGISNAMVAHNASFDRRYWTAELARAGLPAPQPFACTVLLSRRPRFHSSARGTEPQARRNGRVSPLAQRWPMPK